MTQYLLLKSTWQISPSIVELIRLSYWLEPGLIWMLLGQIVLISAYYTIDYCNQYTTLFRGDRGYMATWDYSLFCLVSHNILTLAMIKSIRRIPKTKKSISEFCTLHGRPIKTGQDSFSAVYQN